MLPSNTANVAKLYERDTNEHDSIHQREEEERTHKCSKEDNLILDETAAKLMERERGGREGGRG